MRDSSIYFKMLEILVFDVLEPRDEGSSDYSSMYLKALSAYRNRTRLRLSNYEKQLLGMCVSQYTSEETLAAINYFVNSKVKYIKKDDGLIYYNDGEGYETLVENYNRFNPKDVWTDISESIDLENPSLYKTETKEDLLDLLNELVLDSKVEFLDADTTWDYDENGNRLSWIYQNIKKGAFCSDGTIQLEIDAADLFDTVQEDYIQAWKDFWREVKIVITHEATHRYQDEERGWTKESNSKNNEEYLSEKEEIAARAFGGVDELLGIGYSKEDILDKMKTDESLRELFSETNQLYPYTDFLDYDIDRKILVYLRKQMYLALQRS